MAEEYCVHGAEVESHKKWPEGLAFACPIGTCSCCRSKFTYIDQASYSYDEETGEEEEWSLIWTPEDKCGKCGGKYVETGKSPWEIVYTAGE